ncbi:MAG: hypothetical protein SH847_14380 [Roseiflexaceae bacterium]|nr:hypothetical protein [Roseiflexaceae bacterium]
MLEHLTHVDTTRILRSHLGVRGLFSINDEDYARMVHTAMLQEPRAIRECYTQLLVTLASGSEEASTTPPLALAVEEIEVGAARIGSDFVLALLSLSPALHCLSAAAALTRS